MTKNFISPTIKTEELYKLIQRWGGRESWKIEYKKCQNQLPRSVWETVSAFANTEGGLILLGYREQSGRWIPVGVENPSKIVEDFASTVCEKFNFCPVVQIFTALDGDKEVVVIEVKEAYRYQKPIYIKDAGPLKGGFKRVGSSDLRLRDEDLHRFFRERDSAPDAQPIPGTSIADIDMRSFEEYRRLRELQDPDAPELRWNLQEVLQAYRLVAQDDSLTAAGVLLFGKTEVVRRHFPAFRVDLIRIKGLEWGKDHDPFLSRDFRGNLFQIRPYVIDHLQRFFLMPFQTDVRGDRKGEHPYFKFLREALTNLLMHQNYFHASPSQVRIYNDRIEFYNPGYSLKSPDDFTKPGSELRNPSIAQVFYDVGWAETKGTGLKTILEKLATADLPIPEFINDVAKDHFTVTISYPVDLFGIPQVTGHVTGQVTGQDEVNKINNLMEIHDRKVKILEFCEEPRSLKEIMEFLGLKHRETFMKNLLNPLLKAGLLRRTIPDKPRSRFQKYVRGKKGGMN